VATYFLIQRQGTRITGRESLDAAVMTMKSGRRLLFEKGDGTTM
jgi:hypothetical protein